MDRGREVTDVHSKKDPADISGQSTLEYSVIRVHLFEPLRFMFASYF